MRIHRRQFLQYCVGSAAAMSLPLSVIGKLESAMAADGPNLPKVIWLAGANCTGCTVSLANLFSSSGPTDVADLLINTIDLMYHPNLMGAAGDLAVSQLKATAAGSFILVVEGGVPTAFGGHTCMLWTDQGKEVTAMEAVKTLAPKAAAVLCVGTCASHGGMPSANPNPTGIVSVSKLTGLPTVNIPGCPTHPDWIVYTLAHMLAGQLPTLDSQNRPTALFGREVHKSCPRRESEETKTFGVANRCLKELGCKGERTKSDCPSRKWNNGTNWCVGAGALCIGCTESTFPDQFSPFYKLEYKYSNYTKPATQQPQPQDPSPSQPTDPQPPQGKLAITKAEWNRERKYLTIAGKGDKGKIVTIYNADTGAQLGAVSVNSREQWLFRQRAPRVVPKRVRVVCGSQSLIANVTTR